MTPNKRPAGEKLGRNRQAVNRQINRLRSVVERVIANVKAWRVLHTGFRRPLRVYGRVFSVVRGVGVFWVGDPLCITLFAVSWVNTRPCRPDAMSNQ